MDTAVAANSWFSRSSAGFVEVAEALWRNLAFDIQAVGLLHFVPDLLNGLLMASDKGLFLLQRLFGLSQVGREFLRVSEKCL